MIHIYVLVILSRGFVQCVEMQTVFQNAFQNTRVQNQSTGTKHFTEYVNFASWQCRNKTE